jgi:hypothetical protein
MIPVMHIAKQAWEGIKFLRDLLTVIVFFVGLLAFFSTNVRSAIGEFIARNYGLKAWAYYEVDKQGKMTNDGRLLLLREGGRNFADIKPGDKLMAADGVNMRDSPDKGSVSIIVLKETSCATVLKRGRPQTDFKDTNVGSGGWLLVGTAPCELFDRPAPF